MNKKLSLFLGGSAVAIPSTVLPAYFSFRTTEPQRFVFKVNEFTRHFSDGLGTFDDPINYIWKQKEKIFYEYKKIFSVGESLKEESFNENMNIYKLNMEDVLKEVGCTIDKKLDGSKEDISMNCPEKPAVEGINSDTNRLKAINIYKFVMNMMEENRKINE